MAQNRTDNFNIAAPKSIDNRFLKNGTTMYASTTEAHSLILYKHIGLTVYVDKGGVPTEYHYKDSIADVTDLVEKNTVNTSATTAQLRALSPSVGEIHTTGDGGTWIDIGVNDTYGDDDGISVVATNDHVFLRQYSDSLNVKWFGAKGDGTTNDIAAFNGAVTAALNSRSNIFIPKGTYKLSSKWVIPGRSNASSILVRGEGARNSILDFTTSSDTICVQYGTPASNTIHGGISDLQIQGTQNADGLVISSHAPYSNAFNTFSNIYLFKVKDGITFDGLTSNTSSNYQNFFYNMMVEEHWGRGIYCDGAMNVFDGGFIVAPYGTHGIPASGVGANSCAVYDYGGGNTYNNIPSEDQWLLNGSNTKITRCTIELIQKSVANSAIGDSAFRIGGSGVSIDGFTITTIPNSIIGAIAYIYSPGVNLKNIVYLNPGNISQYNITYPILPSVGSSGVMENISCPTTYGVNHPALYDSSAEWSFINVMGQGGLNFSRIVDLELPDSADLSDLLNKTDGGTVVGYTTLTDANVSNSLELHGLVYDLSNGHYIRNKAGDGYLNTLSKDTTGSEAVLNINNVGTINLNGNPTTFGGTAISQGYITNIGATAVNKILPNGIDANNAGITLQYKEGGTFKDGLILSRTGEVTAKTLPFVINVKGMGAKGDGVTDDIAAFDAAVALAKTYTGAPTIVIPCGRYKLSTKWVVDGFAWADSASVGSWNAIKIQGDGGRTSILDFTTSTTGGLEYGSASTNTLHGGIKNIGIVGNQNIDGLTLVSTAPYTCYQNVFESLYITDVRDGITGRMVGFDASNHANTFISPTVERYWRYGIHALGVYNSYIGLPFVVHPMGTGSVTLALLCEGQSNIFDNFTCEDQVHLMGYENTLNNLRIEKVIKTASYSGFFGQAIQIDGTNNKILGGKCNDFDNTIIGLILYVTGSNIKVTDFQYRNEEGVPEHVISSPAVMENVSNGVLDNVVFNTTNKLDREGFYERAILNWTCIHVEGENGYFDKKSGEIRVEVPPTTGTWAVGTIAVNKTALPNEPMGWVLTDDSPITWRPFGEKSPGLPEVTAVNSVTNDPITSTSLLGAPFFYVRPDNVNDISGFINTQGSALVLQAVNAANDASKPLILNKGGGAVGVGKVPTAALDVSGTGAFTSTVSAADGTSSTHLVTKSQLDNKKAAALTAAALPTTAGVTYTASDVQSLLDRVTDLETKLIAAGLLTP